MKQDIKKLQKEAKQQLKEIKDQQAVIDSVIASLKVEEKLPVKKSTTKKTNNTKSILNLNTVLKFYSEIIFLLLIDSFRDSVRVDHKVNIAAKLCQCSLSSVRHGRA